VDVGNQLSLAPLGAGDLIDRAVRLYRRHLWTLMRMAAPPVIVTAIGWILWTVSTRRLFITSDNAYLAAYVVMAMAAALLIALGHIFNLLVMGGATRNLVAHLLRNEPVSSRSAYAAVRSRFWPLLGAILIVITWGVVSATIAFIGLYVLLIVAAIATIGIAQIAPSWLITIGFIIAATLSIVGALWLFFLLISRVVYVPQVMLVEGRGVFDSVGRSFTLARGNVRRLMAMALFVTFATYAALWILVVPLGWYGYLNGVDPSPWSAASWPIWYAVGYSVLEPISAIMLAPVWMLGLSLLYVDERVRHEGYDIELMAARQLGEMPKLSVESPFGPAISETVPKLLPPMPRATGSVLGLK